MLRCPLVLHIGGQSRKRAEADLLESEQRYRAFISDNSDGMLRLEFEQPIPTGLSEDEQVDKMYRYGYVAECNDAAARISGVTSCEALIGARLEEIAPRTEAQVEHIRNMIRSGYKTDDVEVHRPDKDPRLGYRLESHLGIVDMGNLARIWVTVRDLTELKHIEFEWQASEQRFRQLLELIQMAAVMLDTESCVTFCNDYLLAITGWSRDDLLGGNWFDLMVPD